MVLANHFSVEIERLHSMLWSHFIANWRFAGNFLALGIWKNLFPFAAPSALCWHPYTWYSGMLLPQDSLKKSTHIAVLLVILCAPWSVKMYVSRLILWCITFLQNKTKNMLQYAILNGMWELGGFLRIFNTMIAYSFRARWYMHNWSPRTWVHIFNVYMIFHLF